MSKHTPGPWILTSMGWSVYSDPAASFRHVATVAHNKATRTLESAANGRLIAAAPDLLEALKQFVNALDGHDCPTPQPIVCRFCMGRLAIAKAETA